MLLYQKLVIITPKTQAGNSNLRLKNVHNKLNWELLHKTSVWTADWNATWIPGVRSLTRKLVSANKRALECMNLQMNLKTQFFSSILTYVIQANTTWTNRNILPGLVCSKEQVRWKKAATVMLIKAGELYLLYAYWYLFIFIWSYVLTLRYIMLKNNPSRRLLVSVKPTSPFVLSPNFYFGALSLSLPVPIVFCLSLFHNWIPFSRSFTLCLSVSVPECTEGIRQWQQYSRCSPAVQTGTTEMAVPVLCPAAAAAAAGYTWREEITGSWSARPNEPAEHSLISGHLSLTLSVLKRRIEAAKWLLMLGSGSERMHVLRRCNWLFATTHISIKCWSWVHGPQ